MRIISGTSKGRRLATPGRQSLRPTSDRVKESLFNILGNEMEIEGKTVLDLFAGTGNLGIEALSRGAKKAVFVEKGREVLKLIEKNLAQSGFKEQSRVLHQEVDRAIGMFGRQGELFDLILMDPPYQTGMIEKTLRQLSLYQIYHKDSVLVVEHHRKEPLPDSLPGPWNLFRQRTLGDTCLSFLIFQKVS